MARYPDGFQLSDVLNDLLDSARTTLTNVNQFAPFLTQDDIDKLERMQDTLKQIRNLSEGLLNDVGKIIAHD